MPRANRVIAPHGPEGSGSRCCAVGDGEDRADSATVLSALRVIAPFAFLVTWLERL